jgi:hypothetical protein
MANPHSVYMINPITQVNSGKNGGAKLRKGGGHRKKSSNNSSEEPKLMLPPIP